MSRFSVTVFFALAAGALASCSGRADTAAARRSIRVTPDELAALDAGQVYVADLRDPNVSYVFDARAGAWQFGRVLLISDEGAMMLDAWLEGLDGVDVERAARLEINRRFVIAAEGPPERATPPRYAEDEPVPT